MKRVLAIGLSLAFLCPSVFSQEQEIRFDPLGDPIALGIGLGGAAACQFLLGAERHAATFKADALSPIDAATCFPYDRGLSRLSLGLEIATLAWPSLIALQDGGKCALPAAAACLEALSLTFIAKDLLKYAFPKARPYVYEGSVEDAELEREQYESFPSGHAALAFCAATSFAVLSLGRFPELPSTPWLVGGGFCLAAGASALRVVSGNHFLTDVAAGAALGGGIGWLVAEAHLRRVPAKGDIGEAEARLALDVAPSSLLVKIIL